MNLFSLYVPGNTPLHRAGVGWKYLLLVVLTVPALLVAQPVVSLVALVASLLLLASCRAGLRYSLALPLGLWILVAFLAGYQLLVGRPDLAVVVGTNLVTAVYASRILTLTTPGPALIDALVAALRPFARFGVKPDLVGLAIAIMVRSVPLLLDSFEQVRQAARARGRERNLFLLVTPVVVRAVGQAQATGAALAARGLGES
jgi:biotin transport system permease protein